jgi:hypothetical protein
MLLCKSFKRNQQSKVPQNQIIFLSRTSSLAMKLEREKSKSEWLPLFSFNSPAYLADEKENEP